jgi:hypothetical protein
MKPGVGTNPASKGEVPEEKRLTRLSGDCNRDGGYCDGGY